MVAFCVVSSDVGAVALGVNRASLAFTDVLRGGYAEDVITITTDSEDPVQGELLLEGEAAQWLSFSDRVFNFSRDNQYQLHVMVQPPVDTQVLDYYANLTIITSGLGRTGSGLMGTSTRASFRVPILVSMTGTERLACIGGGLTVLDTEEGRPLEFEVGIINRGNVQINPNITIEVYDKLRSQLIENLTVDFGRRIQPTRSETTLKSVAFDLDASQYWAMVKVPLCDYADLQTFDVLAPGGIKDDGDFLRIDVQSWANTGDIIPVKAIFRNKGERGVRAVFKGTIVRADDRQIVKVIDSDEYIVAPGTTAEILTYFNPQVGGQYVVNGKVFYNNKLTVERSALINVNGAPIDDDSSFPFLIVLIVIVIVILTMLILIKRKKRALGQHR
ncbi:TPA: hypothetical protein HA251_00475 [Candidatus Woesearchaeota archaeon]|nr:hypothetical protein [Candidatus Woesearchaeota archaeon]